MILACAATGAGTRLALVPFVLAVHAEKPVHADALIPVVHVQIFAGTAVLARNAETLVDCTLANLACETGATAALRVSGVVYETSGAIMAQVLTTFLHVSLTMDAHPAVLAMADELV